MLKFSREPRFFDDYEHMLSVIGMIRYAMGISENIVMKSDSYEVEELPLELDVTRSIKRSLLTSSYDRPNLIDRRVLPEIPFDREKESQKQLKGDAQDLLLEQNKTAEKK